MNGGFMRIAGVASAAFLLAACGADSGTAVAADSSPAVAAGSGASQPLPKVTEQSGMLRIATEPGGAQIFVNGQRKGNSPTEPGQSFALKLGEGSYTIEAVLPSDGPEEHYARQQDVFVADHTLQSLTLKLEKRRSERFRAELRKKFGGRAIEPQMVAIPAGSFRMGSPANEPERDDQEGPQRTVNVPAFELGKHEVTFDEWDACVADGGCNHWPEDQGWGRGQRPVINVSWNDITQQYLPWLNKKTGKTYRLPSEAEWEYACRAGASTRFHTGDCITTAQANFDGNHPAQGCPEGEYRQQTVPVGSFAANAFGLHDMHGNVWEWVQDCWHDNYSGAPTDGSAWTTGCSQDVRVLRGGSWGNSASCARAAFRNYYYSPGNRNDFNGFRLARTR